MTTDGSQHSGGMVQQGSIDWVALSRTTVNFSAELLARYTRAGVEPLTIAIGQALFVKSRLPADAQRRLELSVSKLKSYSSAANALWFGIGFKHLIRSLMETEQGAALVAVSSGLMVSYSCEFSAAVLKALCDKSLLPEKLTPALSQWGSLVKLCTPAVIASQFPILVEGFSRLLMSNADKRAPREVVATSPSELGAAILELAQLSTGQIANLTLTGNSDCGWLAALAEWLFSLQVEIVDQSGNTLYQSRGRRHNKDFKSYHLTIVRLEDGQSGIRQSMLHSRTHLVPPGSRGFDLRRETSYRHFYQGRSEWSKILTDTFGSSFRQLLKPRIIPLFAQVLYSALFVDGKESGMSRMSPWEDVLFTHDSQQHRRRFGQMLDFAAARLPELMEVKKYGQDHAWELDNLDQNRVKIPWSSDRSTLDSFKEHFNRSAETVEDKLTAAGYSTALVDACSCSECKAVRQTRLSPSALYIPRDSHQCLCRIATAIFEFIWFLSWLDIDNNIRPSSNGLLNLYSPVFNPPCQIRIACFKEGAFAQVIRLLTGFGAQVFQNPSAVSIHGLCVYRPALENPNKGVRCQLRTRVVPGQIERNDKIYYQLDGRSNPWLKYQTSEAFGIELTTSVLQMLGAHPLLQVAVEETIENASLNMKLVVVSGTNTPMHWNSLFRPSLGSGDDRVPYQNPCYFGTINELFQYIHGSLRQRQCGDFHRSNENRPLWSPHQIFEPWSGRCSVADLSWWTVNQSANDQEPPWIPHSSEWVIAVYKPFNVVQIIIGSVPLLYCLLSKFVITEHSPFLLKLDDCMMCMAPWGRDTQLQNISLLYFSKAGQAQKLDLQPHWNNIYGDKEQSISQSVIPIFHSQSR